MREALAARSGRDFVTAAPPARPRRGPPPAWQRTLRALARRPGAVAVGAVSSAAAVAIALNALAYQTVRHPAPLFAPKPASQAARRPEPGPTVPVPPARPLPAVAAGPVPVAPPARPAPPRDAIAELLRTPASPDGSAKPEASRSVAQAQKALVKLGYGPLDPDGLMGPSTRAALKRFETDRKIAVTGELNPRTTRELSARAGLTIDDGAR